MRSIIEIINETNPGLPPVDGDKITIVYSNGGKERKTYFQKVNQPAPKKRFSKKEIIFALGEDVLDSLEKNKNNQKKALKFSYLLNLLDSFDFNDSDLVVSLNEVPDTIIPQSVKDGLLADVE